MYPGSVLKNPAHLWTEMSLWFKNWAGDSFTPKRNTTAEIRTCSDVFRICRCYVWRSHRCFHCNPWTNKQTITQYFAKLSYNLLPIPRYRDGNSRNYHYTYHSLIWAVAGTGTVGTGNAIRRLKYVLGVTYSEAVVVTSEEAVVVSIVISEQTNNNTVLCKTRP